MGPKFGWQKVFPFQKGVSTPPGIENPEFWSHRAKIPVKKKDTPVLKTLYVHI